MNRIQEIDQLLTELYDELHEAVNCYVDECISMAEPVNPYADIDKAVERISALKAEREYWANRQS